MNKIHTILEQTAALNWLRGEKKFDVIAKISQSDYAVKLVDVVFDMRNVTQTSPEKAEEIVSLCCNMAMHAPIDIAPDKIVFFSGTAQRRAEEFVNQNADYNVIHTTVPGALLEMFQLFDPNFPIAKKQRYKPWDALSERLAWHAQENTSAILDTPTQRSTFINNEIPVFLKNEKLKTINHQPKKMFWENLKIQGLESDDLVQFKNKILSL